MNSTSKGQHLVVKFGTYTHHGIDLGDETVIHYGRGLHNKVNARVEIVSRDVFCAGNPITIRDSNRLFSSDEIVERATSRLGECDYDLFQNNCEHFVNWCRSDVADSAQVNLADAVVRRGTAATVRITLPKVARSFASRVLAKEVASTTAKTVGSKMATRFAAPAALAGDAVQLSAEVLAIRNGKDQQATREIGRRSGALASSGVGFMLGGPTGAAIGFGSWLFGEVVGEAVAMKTDTNRSESKV